MRLIEKSQDAVALLKSGYAGAGLDDGPSAIRAGDNGEGDWERIFAL